MRLLYAALAATLTFPAACAPAPSGAAGWDGVVDTLPGGVVRVVNRAGRVWTDDTAWRLSEDLRLGSADGEGPDLFGEIVGVEADGLGRVWVADAQAGEIRVFSADGSHVRTIGRKGAGPGEFEGLAGMAWGPDGNLWVMDNGNARVAVLDTAGTYVTAHSRRGGLMVTPWRGGFDSEGFFYDQGAAAGGNVPVLNRFSRSMQPAGSLRLPQVAREEFVHVGGGASMSAGVPFTRYLVWRLDGRGGVWVGSSDEYRLARMRFDGDTAHVVERVVQRVPVTPAERDDAVKGLSWFTDAGGQVEISRIPDMKPAFRSVVVDDAGYLWVRPEQAHDAPAALDVFEPAGRYLGSVQLPANPGPFPLLTVRGLHVYAAIAGEDGVPVVVRWRIEGRS